VKCPKDATIEVAKSNERWSGTDVDEG